MRYIYVLFLLMIVQSADAQRLIRRNSRHYVEARRLPEKVAPLLDDSWHQYAPYNNMCPMDSTGERSVVGCVATAMSQVMRYWQHPMQGTGSHEYTDSTGCGLTLFANFSEHTYDWNHILADYTAGTYSQEQADAVALLSLDCGIAVDMRYGSVASGAASIRQPMALANFFGYDKGVQMHFRDFYSLAEITLMLKKELAESRPVLISGYNKNGGHAFVIDGYDENDWFHIRLGNPDNDGDGWTYLPDMVPDQPAWYEKGNPEGGLNFLQMFTTGIMPNDHPQATGIERHNLAFQDLQIVSDGEKPVVIIRDMANVGWNMLSDSVSLMLRRNEEIVCPLYTYSYDFLLEEIDDITYTDTISLSIPSWVEDGTYTIVPMYRDNALQGGKEWREALTSTGTPNYLIASVKDGSVTLQSDTASTAYLTLEDIDVPDFIINGTAPNYSITLKNHQAEIAGRIYLVLEPLNEGGQSFYLQRQGITMAKDEVSTRHFHLTKVYAPSLGTYRLRIFYEANLFTDELIEFELPEEKLITVMSASSIQIALR